MRSIGLLLVVFLVFSFSEAKKKKKRRYKTDNSVIIINEKNFEKVIKSYNSILIELTNSYCGNFCEKYSFEVTKASLQLKKLKPSPKVGRIVLDHNKGLNEKFRSHRVPSLVYYRNGTEEAYTGIETTYGIIKWMYKKNFPPFSELSTLAEISNFRNTHEVTIIFFGNDTKIKEGLEELAKKDDDNFYAYCDFQTAYSNYYAKLNSIIVFKSFGEERTELSGKLSVNGIKNFIKKNTMRMLYTLTDDTIKQIWTDKNPAMIFFLDKNSNKYEGYQKVIKEVAEKLYGRIKVVNSGISDENEVTLLSVLRVDKANLPAIRIIDTREAKRPMYEYKGLLNENEIVKFFEKWERGEIKRMLRSEEIPLSQEQKLYKVVSKSFDAEVLNYEKDVLMLFYLNLESDSSKKSYEELELLSDKLKEQSVDSLRIGAINLRENEVDEVKINSYPSIILFKLNKDNKKEQIKFEGDIILDKIIPFLNENLNLELENKKEDQAEKNDL